MGFSLLRTLCILWIAAPAPAALLHFSGFDPARSGVISFLADGQETTAEAGIMQVQVDGSWSVEALCADLFTGIASGQTYNTNISLPGSAAMGRIAWLMSNTLPTIQPGGLMAQQQGAALQLAVWDIIHDNGDGLNAGRVQMSSTTNASVVAFANSYLTAAWTPTGGIAYFENRFAPSGIAAQNMVAMVPEVSPAGMALTGLALIWFGAAFGSRQSNRPILVGMTTRAAIAEARAWMSWQDYQEALKRAIAPLTDEQLTNASCPAGEPPGRSPNISSTGGRSTCAARLARWRIWRRTNFGTMRRPCLRRRPRLSGAWR